MTYTIEKVSPETKTYASKYGNMIAYEVKFRESEMPAQISKKPETPAPRAGDTMEGTLTMTEYGQKFKKDFSAGAPSSGGGGGGYKPKRIDDNFAMYMSYAKDLVVAMIGNNLNDGSGFKEDEYKTYLKATIVGAQTLYKYKPGPSTPPTPTLADTASTEATEPTGEDVEHLKDIFRNE